MNKLVSVIVPVYNTEDYLIKCIESIRNQTYQEIEIILVDDGSTDGSFGICEQLQRKDERIIVIHKENGGVVSARKKGLEKARGEYSLMIDSDDWIEPEMIARLYEIAVNNHADIVTSGAYRESENTCAAVIDKVKEGVYSEQNEKRYFYNNLIFLSGSGQYGIRAELFDKIMKTTLLKELHSRLSEDIIIGEDAAIVYSACINAEKIVVTHDIFYHYRMRFSSAVHSSQPYFLRSTNDFYLFLKSEMEKSIYKDILLPQLDKYLMDLLFKGMNYYLGLDREVVIPYYDFDKSVINKNAKVVLYGAGRVGQSYYKQVCADNLYRLEGWVDKNYLYYQKQGLNVLPIEALEGIECDYIILALKYREQAEEIKRELIEKYGVLTDKFIWLEPVSILEKYQSKNNKSLIKKE